MKKRLQLLLPLLVFAAVPLAADDWSVGVGAGPFFFGDFVTQTLRLGNENPSSKQTATLSAATRAGVSVDLQRSFSERWALQFEGTFTHAPLSVSGNDSVEIPSGDLNVTTFSTPLVFRINPHGAFRFHLLGGPAYALYDISGSESASGLAGFEGSRGEWGLVAGGGVTWHWSEDFALEGTAVDITTSSPFERSDFPNTPGLSIKRPHNVHTTVGIRYTF
ncbi:MAG TPA: outer membrane beta-barrel protein [Thermoanaerobaculia bacterium]|nr:outer membrane beta-barrel protein [Thermoanaerobaculia bacterium]